MKDFNINKDKFFFSMWDRASIDVRVNFYQKVYDLNQLSHVINLIHLFNGGFFIRDKNLSKGDYSWMFLIQSVDDMLTVRNFTRNIDK